MDVATLYRIAFADDRRPDAWQQTLATGDWPRVLIAPTGSGKTAAVTLGWAARDRLTIWTDVAPLQMPPPDAVEPPRRVIRRKDLDDLFDTDLNLIVFDVDFLPYIVDADDADLRVLWCEHPRDAHRSSYWTGRCRRGRPSQPVMKDRCDEASGGPTPCEYSTERHGGSHAVTRWNGMAP